MKRQLIIIGIIVLLFTIGLSGCFGPTTGYYVEKLNNPVSNFINMTEEQIKHFPLLKESLLTNKTIEVPSPSQEVTELRGVFEYFDTNVICYRNEYYEISVFCAD